MDVVLLTRTSRRSASAARSCRSRAATCATTCSRGGSPSRRQPALVAELARRDAERAQHEARSVEQAQAIAETLTKTVLRFEVKAGTQGVLFGSITPTDIADELWRVRKVRVDRRKIELADPIKRIGRYEVPIEVFQDVTVDVKTLVVPEGGELARGGVAARRTRVRASPTVERRSPRTAARPRRPTGEATEIEAPARRPVGRSEPARPSGASSTARSGRTRRVEPGSRAPLAPPARAAAVSGRTERRATRSS